MIEVPTFKSRDEGIDWVIKNRDLIAVERKNSIKHSDLSFIHLEGENKAISTSTKKVECLIYEAVISKSRNEYMFEQYRKGYVLNHSVGMRYIKYILCVDSDSPENSAYKEAWDKYIPYLINREVADSKGWFWAVTESKNIEGSSVVKGSNFLTPVLEMTVIDENTIKVKAVINVSGIIDSHMDCHIPKCWDKTLKENNYDLFLQEHVMDQRHVMADSINDKLNVYTENIPLSDLAKRFRSNKKDEPSNDTQKEEAVSDTSKKTSRKLFIN